MITIPTELLRTLVAVTDAEGMTRAAERLGRTQPAVSLQIKRLEELIGRPLFERTGRALRLTPAGDILTGYARRILLLHDEAVARVLRPEPAGAVRVGLPNDFAVTLLPGILGEFAMEFPAVSLEVGCALSHSLLDRLSGGDWDVVIAMTGGEPHPSAARIWRESLVWCGVEGMGLDDGAPVPLIVYPEGCTYRRRMIDALERAGRGWRVAYSSASLAGLTAAVQAGLGVTALSARTAPPGLIHKSTGLPRLADVSVGLYTGEGLADAAVRLANFMIAALDKAHNKDPGSP
ncbi:MAG: LysR substrate-binding domain-containing protein [Alphaproteobacteria bacterium]|nr:LysR substrate-binding domain-containing protein [Alphaproteobacteria bacterium]